MTNFAPHLGGTRNSSSRFCCGRARGYALQEDVRDRRPVMFSPRLAMRGERRHPAGGPQRQQTPRVHYRVWVANWRQMTLEIVRKHSFIPTTFPTRPLRAGLGGVDWVREGGRAVNFEWPPEARWLALLSHKTSIKFTSSFKKAPREDERKQSRRLRWFFWVTLEYTPHHHNNLSVSRLATL